MAELTFKSAGVSTREIDLSGPTTVRPQGIPAGVIGTAQKGPAFVPVTVATYADFVADFGGTDGKKFGPLAMNEWMRNARAGTFVRVLGVGDAKKRDGTTGRVNNAGFVVGGQLPQNRTTHDGGALGINPFADDAAGDQHAGRTYFLGALMREVYNSTGESASSMTLSLETDGVLQADAGLSLDGDTTNIRLEDIAGESLMLHFHAGSADGTNQDGFDIERLDATRNLFFTFGEVATLTLTVDDNSSIDNRSLTITDKSGNSVTRVFQIETAAALPTDYAANPAVINIGDGAGNPAAVNDIAAEIRLALEADRTAGLLSIEAPGGAGANVELTMTAVGAILPADIGDHASGDSISQASVSAVAAGGASVDKEALATAVADGINGASIAANLTASADGAIVTIKQGAAGVAGDDARLHEEALIQIDRFEVANGTPGDVGQFVITDSDGVRTLTVNFVEGPTTPASEAGGNWSADIDIRDAQSATLTMTGTDAEAHFHNAQQIQVLDGDTQWDLVIDEAALNATTKITGVTPDGMNPSSQATITVGTSDIADTLSAHMTMLEGILESIRDGSLMVDVLVHDTGGGVDDTLANCIVSDATAVPPLGAWTDESLSTVGLADDTITINIPAGAAGNAFAMTNTSTDLDLPNGVNDGAGSDARTRNEVLADLEIILDVATSGATGLDFHAIPADEDYSAGPGNRIFIRHGRINHDGGAPAAAVAVAAPAITDATDWIENIASFQAPSLGTALDAATPATLTLLGEAGGVTLSTASGVFAGGGDAIEDADPTHSNWRDAGIDTGSQSKPIIRAVLMTPGGVHATLLSAGGDAINAGSARSAVEGIANADEATAEALSGGSQFGLVDLAAGKERFTLLLNGHVSSDKHPAELTCSFDPQAADYFINVLNSDPACIEMAGHCVYASYDIHGAIASVDVSGHEVVSGDGAVPGELVADGGGVPAQNAQAGERAAAFLIHGNSNPDFAVADAAELPIYEDFQERFQTAKSPWIISQVYGAKPKNLFKIHALDDGIAGSGKFKITISNIMMGAGEEYGRFDVFVRDISDDDVDPRVFEKFIGVDLNPASDRYIARAIGDQFMYYDFDKRPGSQKLVVEGIHPQRSKYIRVEMAPEVGAGAVPNDALPLGHRGYDHLVTSANGADSSERFLQDDLTHIGSSLISNVGAAIGANEGSIMNDAIEPPVPFRLTIAQGTGDKKRPQPSLCWGTMFQVMDNLIDPNNSVKFNSSILSYGKFYPGFRRDSQQTVSVGNNSGVKPKFDHNGTGDPSLILDADKFNNNMFTLERIQVITKVPTVAQDANPQVLGKIDHRQWAVAEYRRNGELKDLADTLTLEGEAADGVNIGRRFLDPKVDLTSPTTRRYMKFSFFLQGGFDGTNIFDAERSALTNRAAVWEMDDPNQGGVNGSTVAGFRKAIDVMSEKADVDIKLLAIPGMRDEAITDYAIDAVEDRFDAMYIMDIEEKSVQDQLMVDYSSQKPSVNLTVEELKGRNLDSSFAAAYFPDVVITDPALGTNVQCPPSVAVLGAFSLNDSVAHPWFAPAGFSRGALTSVVETQVKLSRTNLDALYESDINPLAAFPHTPGVVVWGQKTLQRAQSALDRVNVRRLLIEIRREVRNVGNSLLFEPNREETLGRFSAAVNPILQRIQQQQGLDKFKVVIDTTTTTQADIENNTVRGKIFLQPTRTVEFISLDFVVTNAGMEV